MSNPKKSILITFEGDTTRATLLTGYRGDTRVKTAFAKRNRADAYDAFEGARIALTRLFGRDPFPVDDEPKFSEGDIVRLKYTDPKRGFVKDALCKVFYKAPNKMTPYLAKVLDEPSNFDSAYTRHANNGIGRDVVLFAGEMRKIEEGK